MGRKVQIRAEYKRDALFLIRLGQAIEIDLRRSAEWRKQACGMIQQLSVMFMQVDDEKPVQQARKPLRNKGKRRAS